MKFSHDVGSSRLFLVCNCSKVVKLVLTIFIVRNRTITTDDYSDDDNDAHNDYDDDDDNDE